MLHKSVDTHPCRRAPNLTVHSLFGRVRFSHIQSPFRSFFRQFIRSFSRVRFSHIQSPLFNCFNLRQFIRSLAEFVFHTFNHPFDRFNFRQFIRSFVHSSLFSSFCLPFCRLLPSLFESDRVSCCPPLSPDLRTTRVRTDRRWSATARCRRSSTATRRSSRTSSGSRTTWRWALRRHATPTAPVHTLITPVALTQISVYSTHKNLAVTKIIEATRTAYAKLDSVCTRCKLHMRKTITECTRILWKECAHRLRTFYFAESFDEPVGKGAFEMRHSFLYFVWYPFPNFCTRISRPLAYSVRISSKACATPVITIKLPQRSDGREVTSILLMCWLSRVFFLADRSHGRGGGEQVAAL